MSIPVHSATLNPKEERRLLRGHAWAYRNEFKQLPDAEDGAVVDVFASNRRFVGRGFFQKEGGIAVRLLTRRQEDIGPSFFQDRVQRARAFREQLFPGQSVYRWVFGESDGLPGLVADRYGAVVSVQTSCAFYETFFDDLSRIFLAQPGVRSIVIERNGHIRRSGEVRDPVECQIEDIHVGFSLASGQKTGLFLDQRCNQLAMRRFASGARVLDGHCYVGLWSCHAALAGATSVVGADTSAQAIEWACANAARNGVTDRCRFECTDIESLLEQGNAYDLIILDPPAFAKSRTQSSKALARYQALNAAALRCVEPGGILITCSCSHFIDSEAFIEMLKHAASAAQRTMWLLELRGAAPDHPILLSMPETNYLKCAVLRVF